MPIHRLMIHEDPDTGHLTLIIPPDTVDALLLKHGDVVTWEERDGLIYIAPDPPYGEEA